MVLARKGKKSERNISEGAVASGMGYEDD